MTLCVGVVVNREGRKTVGRREREQERPEDREGVLVGKEIEVSGDRKVLWECRNRNPCRFSLLLVLRQVRSLQKQKCCGRAVFFFFLSSKRPLLQGVRGKGREKKENQAMLPTSYKAHPFRPLETCSIYRPWFLGFITMRPLSSSISSAVTKLPFHSSTISFARFCLLLGPSCSVLFKIKSPLLL